MALRLVSSRTNISGSKLAAEKMRAAERKAELNACKESYCIYTSPDFAKEEKRRPVR